MLRLLFKKKDFSDANCLYTFSHIGIRVLNSKCERMMSISELFKKFIRENRMKCGKYTFSYVYGQFIWKWR